MTLKSGLEVADVIENDTVQTFVYSFSFTFHSNSTMALSCIARATVELLRQETPNFLAFNLWPPNSPDLSILDYEIWAVMQHCVYHRQIHSVDELKRRLIDV